jgi:tetratricopeptide (TPR) repeat protein
MFHFLGQYEEMLSAAERAAEIAGAIENDRLLALATERRGTALNFLGRSHEARPVLEEAVPLLEHVGDLERLSAALSNLGEAHRVSGRLQEARHFNEQSLEVGERVGNPSNIAFTLMNLGQIRLSLGGWEETLEDLARAEEVLAAVPSASNTTPYVFLIRGQVFLAMGRWAEAEGELQRGLALGEARGDRQVLEQIHPALAELEVLRGEPEGAIARLEPLAGREDGYRVTIETTLAWALLEAGDVARAGLLIGETVSRGRNQTEALALVDALRVQGMVLGRQERRDEAEHILEEGLALARSLPYPYAEARILAELGRLEEAQMIFQWLGAMTDVERTEATMVGSA